MVNKIDLLLSEYEQLTGRSPTWREDLSVSDFLQLRDYAKKASLGNSYVSNIEKPTPVKEPKLNPISREDPLDNKTIEKTNNTVQFNEAIKRQDIHKENKQSAVDILKAIKD